MACPEVGDTSAARVASDELVEVAYGLGTALLRAQAARATGAVLLAEGDAQSALIQLRKAFHEFHTLGVCYDAARTRLLIAEACQALGDHGSAGMERAAAQAALESLRTTVVLIRPGIPGGSIPWK